MFRQIWKNTPLSQISSFGNFRDVRKSFIPNFITQNAKLYLDFANPLCYSGSGATATDLSGTGNNATLVNTPTLSPVNNGVLVFNGTNTYANVSGTSTGGNQFSIMFWVKFTSFGSNQRPVSKDGGSGTNRDWLFQMNGAGTSLGFIAWNTSGTLYSAPMNLTFNTNNWYHIAATYDSASDNLIKSYVNGVRINSVSISGALRNNTNVGVSIGRYGLGGEHLNGSIGQVAIYTSTDAVLSPAEIKNNFDANRTRYGA